MSDGAQVERDRALIKRAILMWDEDSDAVITNIQDRLAPLPRELRTVMWNDSLRRFNPVTGLYEYEDGCGRWHDNSIELDWLNDQMARATTEAATLRRLLALHEAPYVGDTVPEDSEKRPTLDELVRYFLDSDEIEMALRKVTAHDGVIRDGTNRVRLAVVESLRRIFARPSGSTEK